MESKTFSFGSNETFSLYGDFKYLNSSDTKTGKRCLSVTWISGYNNYLIGFQNGDSVLMYYNYLGNPTFIEYKVQNGVLKELKRTTIGITTIKYPLIVCTNSFSKEFFVVNDEIRYDIVKTYEGKKGDLRVIMFEGSGIRTDVIKVIYKLKANSKTLPYGYKPWICSWEGKTYFRVHEKHYVLISFMIVLL